MSTAQSDNHPGSQNEQGTMAPSEDPSWANYRQTILELFPEHDPLRIDLRRPVSDETRATMRDRGVPETAAATSRTSMPRARSPLVLARNSAAGV